MPIPTPRSGEEQSKFISRCISSLSHTDPSRPPKQIQAICFDKWRSKGKKGVRGGDRGGPKNRPLRQSIKYLVPITFQESVEGEAKIGGTAISATTSRNKITYKVEGLEKNKSLEGTNISVGHTDSPADNIGIIGETKFDGKNLNYTGKIYNTDRYKDAIDMVKKKLWQFVSIEAIPIDIKKEKEGLTVNDLEFIGLAFVKSPGVREASAALQGESFGNAIHEAFITEKNIEEENIMSEEIQPEEEKEEVEEKKEETKTEEKVKVIYKTDPALIKLLEKVDKRLEKLEEQAEEKEEAEKAEEPEEEEEEEVEEKSKAVVQEEISEEKSNIVWEGTSTNSSFWVHPGPKGEFREAI